MNVFVCVRLTMFPLKQQCKMTISIPWNNISLNDGTNEEFFGCYFHSWSLSYSVVSTVLNCLRLSHFLFIKLWMWWLLGSHTPTQTSIEWATNQEKENTKIIPILWWEYFNLKMVKISGEEQIIETFYSQSYAVLQRILHFRLPICMMDIFTSCERWVYAVRHNVRGGRNWRTFSTSRWWK